MDNLQLLLSGDKRTASDITIYLKEDGVTMLLYLGVCLFDSVPKDPASVRYKICVAQLFGMGFGRPT